MSSEDKNTTNGTDRVDLAKIAVGASIALLVLHAAAGFASEAVESALADIAVASVAYSIIASNWFLLVCLSMLGLSLSKLIFASGSAPREGENTSELKMAQAEITRLTHSDPLTGLPNRIRFENKLEALVEARRESQKPFCVALIDLEGFKPINDIYGHAAGDDILKQVALRLQGAAEHHGVVARSGGAEFAVAATDISSEEDAQAFGEMLCEVLAAPFDVEGRKARLSSSFGFALFPGAGSDSETLLSRADTALYQSKRTGGNNITIFSEELAESMRQEARIEQALRRAIAEKSIHPHFQPIVDLKSGRILGFEALARWTDKELGLVSPAVFIPIAEQRGLIADIAELLLDRAAREATRWPDHIFLSFNLSAAQLADPATGTTMLSLLEKTGLDPHRLEIEVTETAVMSDPKTATNILETLREAGVRIALDDFGTGHSSLGYLRELALDKVKIDRSFVMRIGKEKQSDHIIKAILEMCSGLELNVVAEGIEEESQANDLIDFGCDAGQGYLYGRPMTARNAIRLFEEIAARNGTSGSGRVH